MECSPEVSVTIDYRKIGAHLRSARIDQFGEHFPYRQIDNTHFQATIPVKLTRSFWGWIFEHAGSIRIAAPESVQTQYRNMLRRALESIN